MDADPASLWLYLADYNNSMRLVVPGGSAKLVGGEFGQIGARYRVAFQWEGLDSVSTMRLAAADSPVLLRWEWRAPHGSSTIDYRISQARAGRTDLEVYISLDFCQALKPMEPFGWALFTRMHERGMRKLCELDQEAITRAIETRERADAPDWKS